ncbi:hypothetical protein, partial [Ligaoa zhengdingensis]|uniref:hypothetical protein n=1 Tax=Ligaoa zhengdingensis TaxID=2763658 RepID=UPI0031B9DF66
RSDFRTIAEGACRVSATSAQILSPARGFQKGKTLLCAFKVNWPIGSREGPLGPWFFFSHKRRTFKNETLN